jgi:hypothetical protein
MAPQGNSRTSVNLEDIANLVGTVTKATSLLNNKRSYKTVTPFFHMSPQVRRRGQALIVFARLFFFLLAETNVEYRTLSKECRNQCQ